VSTVLEAEGLVTSYPFARGRVAVVDGVGLRLEAGRVLALVGESGCGKSQTALTLLRLVAKPGRIDAGSVRLLGRELLHLPVPQMRAIRGSGIAMIFQEPMTSLNPVVRVGAQVVEAIRLHEQVGAAAAHERALALFRRVGIPDPDERFDAYPHQLSGGLKQRVMIAAALSTHPRVLIADEPTTALDVTIQAQILQLLRDLQRELETAILLITHDFGVVNELADRVAVMYGGRIVEEGPREKVLGHPAHPYTQGLLRSMPGRARPGQRLEEIPGVVPPPAEWLPGCRFATRCPRVRAACAAEPPPEVELAAGHRTFCFAVAEEGPA